MRPSILLVDDSPSNIRTLIEFLRADYKILVATSGAVALEVAGREALDLVLLDVVMPEMDGHEVCRRLKADPRTASVPVIFVTGKSDEADEMAGFELGAVDYIHKPYSLPLVQRRIRTHLELKRLRDELERQSLQDALTGLPNRRCFETQLGLAWRHAIGQQAALAVVLLDVDHFKAYNDHYGHPAGDDCLRQVGAGLAAVKRRGGDLIARYGGEEFVCVLPETDRDGARQFAEALRGAVATLGLAHAYSSAAAHVTVSVGISSGVPQAGTAPTSLVDAADQALYRAKQAGRNRVGE